MCNLLDFTKKQGVKKLTSKQKVAITGGFGQYTNHTNSPPKSQIDWGKPKG